MDILTTAEYVTNSGFMSFPFIVINAPLLPMVSLEGKVTFNNNKSWHVHKSTMVRPTFHAIINFLICISLQQCIIVDPKQIHHWTRFGLKTNDILPAVVLTILNCNNLTYVFGIQSLMRSYHYWSTTQFLYKWNYNFEINLVRNSSLTHIFDF